MKRLVSKVIFSLYRGTHTSFGYKLRRVPGAQAIVIFLFGLASRLLPRIIEVHGSKMYIDTRQPVPSIAVAANHYDIFTTELFRKMVREGDTVIDLGANFGYYTLLASRIVGNQGKVYAFEPNPKTYSLLIQNIELNKYNNVIAVPKAVTNYVGTAELFTSIDSSTDSLYREDGQTKSIKIETETLDHFFEHKDDTVNVIKMDIEGGEIDALSGMDRLISQKKNLKMFVEFAPQRIIRAGHTPEEFWDKLRSHNFEVFAIDEEKRRLIHIDSPGKLMETWEYLSIVNLLVTGPQFNGEKW